MWPSSIKLKHEKEHLAADEVKQQINATNGLKRHHMGLSLPKEKD